MKLLKIKQIWKSFLPDKFVSKKNIVALIKVLNILLCKFIEAFILIDTNVINLMVVIIVKNNVMHPKTFIHVCREIVIHQILLAVETLFLFWKTCSSKFTLNFWKVNILFLIICDLIMYITNMLSINLQ